MATPSDRTPARQFRLEPETLEQLDFIKDWMKRELKIPKASRAAAIRLAADSFYKMVRKIK